MHVMLTMLQHPWSHIGVGGVVHLPGLLRSDGEGQQNWWQEAQVLASDAHVVVAEQCWPVRMRESAQQ